MNKEPTKGNKISEDKYTKEGNFLAYKGKSTFDNYVWSIKYVRFVKNIELEE